MNDYNFIYFRYYDKNVDPHLYTFDKEAEEYWHPVDNHWYYMGAEYFDFQVFNKVYVVEKNGN